MKRNKRILVGISGGVDSAVAVSLLQKRGYIVQGVFLKMIDDEESWQRSLRIADFLGISLLKKDVREQFRKEIINEFILNYKHGLTPNPCVFCNSQIKFSYLLKLAEELGVEKIATGHYVRVQKRKNANGKNQYFLKKGKDKIKDQSYFLYRLNQSELSRTIFPLGDFSKEQVKNMAKDSGLKITEGESQDICFLNNSSLNDFFQKEIRKNYFLPGDILDEKLKQVGKHKGLLKYTIGQRKGIDVGGDGPFYVIAKDFQKNTLLVSRNKNDLFKNKVSFENVNWINNHPIKGKNYQVKIRYQMQSVSAFLAKEDFGRWEVFVSNKKNLFNMVAPGQSLVIYDKDVVIGGGIIKIF